MTKSPQVHQVQLKTHPENRRSTTQNEHRQILQAIRDRDKKSALEKMETHIRKRLDQINANLKEGLSRIYWGSAA